MHTRLPLTAALFLVLGCPPAKDAAPPGQLPPPMGNPTVPNDLKIVVTINGQPAPPIDKTRLSARAPDFKDPDHQAWKIAPLLGIDAATPITVVGERGIRLMLPHAQKPGDPEPVLFLTRRGEVTAAVVSPADPFPSYHGQGRQLARPGDPLPRLAGRLLEIHVGAQGAIPSAEPAPGPSVSAPPTPAPAK